MLEERTVHISILFRKEKGARIDLPAAGRIIGRKVKIREAIHPLAENQSCVSSIWKANARREPDANLNTLAHVLLTKRGNVNQRNVISNTS